MFNSYFLPKALTEVKYVKTVYVPVARVARFDADVATLVPSSEVVIIDPRLKWRSVTPSQRQADGVPMSPSATNFLRPSLEDVVRVSSVLASIDDKFSYQAALEKFSKAVENSAPTSEPTNPSDLSKSE